ncbi:MAG: site-2 protease family protein [Candidatus Paraimprobicoccus trichonymphae]|uniref:Site-2 protease family protein n=1 Tax=Candidatus Paraimprobicoccus trichonymphae TaxID=3033793 RepID=A0AA48KYZ1_9FIRM|nr:MAG: site-2 protease family protein [Candidatus Paraimprobicoccus trichonymphae]
MFWFLQHDITFESALIQILAILAVIFFSLPFHEFAHAWVAYKFGDNTAKIRGLLKINFIDTFDPLGAVSVLIFNFGWARPIPTDSKNLQNPKKNLTLISLAGPVSNLAVSIISGLIVNILVSFKFYSISSIFLKKIYIFLSYFIMTNVRISVLNLIPLPSLDGFNIFISFLPEKIYVRYFKYHNLITLSLIFLVFLGIFDIPLRFLESVFYNSIILITRFPFIFLENLL